ncbi:uncharacterized protein YALI1_C14859g [Yarrowia lipolytica]|uniref:Uncharacterized protein n=1 Tax=Yarrowia lipolytica TaxID=4952 RepID=A0A1D8NAI0_YARLL|nr:hypothetical protein YALI1_C14859g [Yarrowia lipolytica]
MMTMARAVIPSPQFAPVQRRHGRGKHLMKLFQPSKQIKAKVSFFNDEIIPMDFYTACGVLALAPLV